MKNLKDIELQLQRKMELKEGAGCRWSRDYLNLLLDISNLETKIYWIKRGVCNE